MQLIDLVISRSGHVIRKVTFKPGLNLILDHPTDSATQTGNNIGKTTVLRLIDFCLGSDGDDIWQDAEFKRTNQEVYDFLFDTPPVAVTLRLLGATGDKHELRRSFIAGKSKNSVAFYVDDKVLSTLKEYQASVKKILFGNDGAKPSLRQLAPKFVRSSTQRMGKTLKFLGDYASQTDYEGIHLFLFGFVDLDVLEERPRLNTLHKRLTRDLQAISRDRGEGELEQLLLHTRREIDLMEVSSVLRGEVPEIAARANEITQLRSRASAVSGALSGLEAEIFSIRLSIDEFDREDSGVDEKVIESIYMEAERYFPKLHKDWSELSDFIHCLRSRKQRFLRSQLKNLTEQLELARPELRELEEREKKEVESVSAEPAFLKALELRAGHQEKLKKLGSIEQDLQDIKDLKTQISTTEANLKATQARIEDGKKLLGVRVAIFNKYFAELSKELYGEQYLLHFEETDKGALSFALTAVGANVGTGKKMSQTAAFDLAYIAFLIEAGLHFPRFVCHDGLEAIHGNQLYALLTAASESQGQLILATLRDKLPQMPADFVAHNTILELSHGDKLFGL